MISETRLGTDVVSNVTFEIWCKIGQANCDRVFCDGCQHRILKIPEIRRQ